MAPTREQMEAYTCLRSSSSASSLLGRCLANPHGLQGRRFEMRVVVLFLCPSGIADEGNIVDCDAN